MNTEYSYLILCDLLGFSNMIRHLSDDPVPLNRLLLRFSRASTQAMSHIEEHGEEFKLFRRNKHFKVFSDNLVLTYPTKFRQLQDEGNYGLISQAAAVYQFQMALSGFFVRGGFALGHMYMNTNMVFGDAIIEAYRLETKLAIYPRIVLSDEMKVIVQHHLGFYAHPDQSPQQRYLLSDDSGNLFINYLGTAVSGDYYEPVVAWDLLLRHKDRVVENLVRFAGNSRVLKKYRWLAGYHNYYCHVLSDLDGFNRNVLVPGIQAKRGLHLIADVVEPRVLRELLPG